jgi:hypothetical protein
VLRGTASAPATKMFDPEVARPLAVLHALADAEVVEAAVNHAVRAQVRRRLAAADRLARCLLASGSILPGLGEGAHEMAAALVAQLADGTTGMVRFLQPAAIESAMQAAIAENAGRLKRAEQLAAQLRLLRVVGAMVEAIAVLREGLGLNR